MNQKPKQKTPKNKHKRVVPNTHPLEAKQYDKAGHVKKARLAGQKMARGEVRPQVERLQHNDLEKNKATAKMSFGSNNQQLTKVGTNVMNIQGDLQTSSLQIAIATYLSSLYAYNAVGSYINSIGQPTSVQPWAEVAEGAAYLGSAIQQISTGATLDIVKVPRIFDVLSQMLTEKTVRLGRGIVKYSPTWTSVFEFPGSIQTPTGAVWTATPPDTGATITIQTAPFAPSPESYSVLLKMSDYNKNFGSQAVKTTKTS